MYPFQSATLKFARLSRFRIFLFVRPVRPIRPTSLSRMALIPWTFTWQCNSAMYLIVFVINCSTWWASKSFGISFEMSWISTYRFGAGCGVLRIWKCLFINEYLGTGGIQEIFVHKIIKFHIKNYLGILLEILIEADFWTFLADCYHHFSVPEDLNLKHCQFTSLIKINFKQSGILSKLTF